MSDLSLIENFDLSIFEVKDKMVNLTKIGKHFGKDVNTWLKSKKVQEFISKLNTISDVQNLTIAKGGDIGSVEQGTFGTEKVALKFAEYISTDFEIWANDKIHTLINKGKVELAPQPTKQDTPSYQIEDPIKRAETWILEQKSKQKLQLENKQQASEIKGLANNLKETKETLAKNYKTVQARNKAEIGLSINRLVNKFFKTDDLTFAQACHKAWDSYYEVTGVHYYGATNSSFEEKLSFLNFLLSL